MSLSAISSLCKNKHVDPLLIQLLEMINSLDTQTDDDKTTTMTINNYERAICEAWKLFNQQFKPQDYPRLYTHVASYFLQRGKITNKTFVVIGNSIEKCNELVIENQSSMNAVNKLIDNIIFTRQSIIQTMIANLESFRSVRTNYTAFFYRTFKMYQWNCLQNMIKFQNTLSIYREKFQVWYLFANLLQPIISFKMNKSNAHAINYNCNQVRSQLNAIINKTMYFMILWPTNLDFDYGILHVYRLKLEMICTVIKFYLIQIFDQIKLDMCQVVLKKMILEAENYNKNMIAIYDACQTIACLSFITADRGNFTKYHRKMTSIHNTYNNKQSQSYASSPNVRAQKQQLRNQENEYLTCIAQNIRYYDGLTNQQRKNMIVNHYTQYQSDFEADRRMVNVWLTRKPNSKVMIILRNIASLKECNWLGCLRKDKKLKRCENCLSVYYCSRKCQKLDWSHNHQFRNENIVPHRIHCKHLNTRDYWLTRRYVIVSTIGNQSLTL